MDNEEQQLEILALQSIFMDDFQLGDKPNEFSLELVPYIANSNKNYVKVKLLVRLPPSYPQESLQETDIKIVDISNTFDNIEIQRLKRVMIAKARECAPSPAIYEMIEAVKEKLELYNYDAAEGSFIVFSDETLLNVMQYLEPFDLCRCSMVNHTMKRLADDNANWKPIVQNQPDFYYYSAINKIDLIQSESNPFYWKNYYLEMKQLKVPEYEYVAVIVERKGTGDGWYEHIGSWKKHFQDSFHKAWSHITLTKVRQMKSLVDGQVMGFYRLCDKTDQSITSKIINEKWYQSLLENIEKCPYIGDVIGYMLLSAPLSQNEFFFKSVLYESRGALASLKDPSKFVLSVKYDMIHLGHFLNRYDWDNSVLLVNPRNVQTQTKYLNDLVNKMNGKLSRIKKEEPGKYVGKTYVEYQDMFTKKLYPFVLDDSHLISILEEKWSYFWVHPDQLPECFC